MNPFEIGKPCIIISRRELLFEEYRMALKQYKYDIKIKNDNTKSVTKYYYISCKKRSIVWMDYINMKKVF